MAWHKLQVWLGAGGHQKRGQDSVGMWQGSEMHARQGAGGGQTWPLGSCTCQSPGVPSGYSRRPRPSRGGADILSSQREREVRLPSGGHVRGLIQILSVTKVIHTVVIIASPKGFLKSFQIQECPLSQTVSVYSEIIGGLFIIPLCCLKEGGQ